MTQRTYHISKGQQYDREGAQVSWGVLTARYRADGKYDCGDFPRLTDLDAVSEAVARVIASGESETLTTGPVVPLPADPWADSRAGLAACRHWSSNEGCPLHGDLCNPAYRS